jgi:phosphomannomutase
VETRRELEALIAANAIAELRERMGPELDFGTAGLRAPVGAGPARINRAVVIRATRAFAEHLIARVPDARTLPVVVGYDARPTSRAFADAAIGVLLAAGLNVRYFDAPAPTPLVAYAARVLAASGALVVTASHNPRPDNGLKIYGPHAIQLVAPADADVAGRRERLGPAASVPSVDPRSGSGAVGARLDKVPADLFDRYLAELAASLPPLHGTRPLAIAYSPLHGLGRAPVERALRSRGFTNISVVPEQAEPDGTFPTAPAPNPELEATLAPVLALAAQRNAELVLVNDPDVDRLAAAAPLPSGRYRVLNGNELAALLSDFLLDPALVAARPFVVSSIVSSELISKIAESRGARAVRTLTGFKWIWTAARALEAEGAGRFVLGCEEALGFSVGGLVRDKDGISAAVWLAELAERCRRDGQTLVDRLHAIYARVGAWGSAQRSLEVQGRRALAALREALRTLVAAPPELLDGRAFTALVDYRSGAETRPPWLGRAELYELHYGEGTRVLIRPSGTEPKLKIYADVAEPAVPSELAEAAARRARARAEALAAAFAERLSVGAQSP